MATELYSDPAIPNDEGQVAEINLAKIEEIDEDWTVEQGDVETTLSEATATAGATAGTTLNLNLREAFAEVVGSKVVGVTRDPAVAAKAIATITVDVSTGVTLDAGAEFGLTPAASSSITDQPFILPEPLVFPDGTDTLTDVELVAVELGEDFNGATGPVATSVSRVQTVTITSSADGGAEEEDVDAYLDRIVRRRRRLNFIPGTAAQLAAAAVDDESVARCAYFNRYDPANPGDDSPGFVCLVPIDIEGDDFDPEGVVVERILAQPEFSGDDRPIQWTTTFERATYIDFAVAVTVRLNPNFGEDETEDAIDAAIGARHNKATWDYDAASAGLWRPTPASITAFDVASIIGPDSLGAVARVLAVTVNGGSSVALTPAGSSPVALPNYTGVVVTFA